MEYKKAMACKEFNTDNSADQITIRGAIKNNQKNVIRIPVKFADMFLSTQGNLRPNFQPSL